jgi:hypothetical protein
MTGLNLHGLVRQAITAVHPDELVTLHMSSGQTNVKGKITAAYHPPVQVMAQVQSLKPSELDHSGLTGQAATVRYFYFYSGPSAAESPNGVFRPLARTGDMIQRADGTWWLVTAPDEDFARVGWVRVIGTLQVK